MYLDLTLPYKVADMSLAEWGRVVLAGTAVFAVAEVEKWVQRRWRAKDKEAPAGQAISA